MEFDCLGFAGYAIRTSEKVAIHCSLTVLAQHLKTRLTFWGKVLGYHNDYLIAQTISADPTSTSVRSFASVDGGTNWIPLPFDFSPDQIEFCRQIRGRYTGKLDYEYKIRKDIPPTPEVAALIPPPPEDAEEEAEGDDGAVVGDDAEELGDGDGEAPVDAPDGDDGAEDRKPKKKKPKFQIIALAEAIRVAYFIQQADHHCRLVVRGSFLRRDNGTLCSNRTWEGLHPDEVLNANNYLKARCGAASLDRNRDIFGASFSAQRDFLPPITEDRPEGVWTVKYDNSLGVVTIQNLQYDGFLFWHKPATAECGHAYYGAGEENFDLCFMLP